MSVWGFLVQVALGGVAVLAAWKQQDIAVVFFVASLILPRFIEYLHRKDAAERMGRAMNG